MTLMVKVARPTIWTKRYSGPAKFYNHRNAKSATSEIRYVSKSDAVMDNALALIAAQEVRNARLIKVAKARAGVYRAMRGA